MCYNVSMRFVILSSDDFREFATKSPYVSFMQTVEIAKLRESEGWTAYYFGATEDDEVKAAAMLVAKPTFLGKSTFICPGGPLMDYEDATLVNFFLKHLKAYARSHNGYALTISPYYELTARDRDGNKIEGGFDHQKAITTLKSNGFTEVPHASQPKYMFAMDLAGRTPDQIFADFKSKTRNHIKKAEKMGVKVRELGREELDILKKITEATSKRRGFTDRPLEYYEKMYDLFHDKGEVKFLVAEAIIGPEGIRSAAARGQAPSARGDGPDGRGPKADNCSAIVPLSAAMFMLVGSEVVYLFSGSDEQYMKDYNAQYLIQWDIIKYAAAHGFKRYNFYGIHDLPKNGELDGIYEFKKGFDSTEHGHVLEFIGTFETPVDSIFFALHQLLKKLKI